MDCPNIKEKLSAYIDEALSSQEKMAVDEHLRSCSRCAADLADLKETIQQVKEVEPVEPPLWLRQKIMAKVRAEAQPKKGLFQRLFYPLHIKLPVGAVATIAIALTTLYIVRTMEPEIKLAKAPTEEIAPQVSQEDQQPSRRDTKADKIAPVSPALAPRILPVDKGKIDDRKTAPAIPAEQPVPSKEPELMRDRITPAPKAPEHPRGAMQEQGASPPAPEKDRSMPAAGAVAKKEAKSEAAPATPGLKALAEEKRESIRLTVYVKDMESARRVIEKNVMELGGKITLKKSYENKDILSAEITSKNVKEFYERLMSVGQVKGKDIDFEKLEGEVSVSVEVVRIPEER